MLPLARSRPTPICAGDSADSSLGARLPYSLSLEEVMNLGQKALPGRLALQQDVVLALDRHEPRAGDQGGNRAPRVEGYPAILARVEDQCGRGDPRRQVADIDLVECAQEAHRVLRRGRQALEVVEPAQLLGGALGDERGAEHLPERHVGLAPAYLRQLDVEFCLFPLLRVALEFAAGVAAVENQVADPL